METLAFKSTLEESFLAGFDQVGRVGIAVPYWINGDLPLWWRVRVVDENDNLLANAPYSLAFGSRCCVGSIHYRYDATTDGDEITCAGCSNPQLWAPSAEPLSILGPRLPETQKLLAQACGKLFEMNALEAALMANAIVANIGEVHEKWITPAWATNTREQVLAVYPPLDDRDLELLPRVF